MINTQTKVLVTLGPASMNEEVITGIDKQFLHVFRINMSHTPIDKLEESILTIQKHTDVPICIDSEGAQIRNGYMKGGAVEFTEGENIKISGQKIEGDSNSVYLTPDYICGKLKVGDVVKIDFNSVKIKVTEANEDHCLAVVEAGGKVGSNKAADVNREIELDPITPKDKEAIVIAKKHGIRNFALSFANSEDNVNKMRELVGPDANVISKVESISGLNNLDGILRASDEILIDRGDLSRQVDLHKIPFVQRRIISIARSKGVPVFVATNLLESMIVQKEPTRAEINDIVSTLLMGADGLVLAAETAIGAHPVKVIDMVNKLILQSSLWTPNSSMTDIINSAHKQ